MVWIDLTNGTHTEEDLKFELTTSLQIGSEESEAQVDTFIITLPSPKANQQEGYLLPSDQNNESAGNDPNLDLELETVREEGSPIFLLLKTAPSPLIVLANMAIHGINQAKNHQQSIFDLTSQTEEKIQPMQFVSSNERFEASEAYEAIDLTSQHNSRKTMFETSVNHSLTPDSDTVTTTEQQGIIELW